MAGKKVRFEDAAAEIEKQLVDAWGSKSAKLIAISESIAQEMVDELQNKSPKKTGFYAKGWRQKSDIRNDGYGGRFTVYIVYNGNRPQLTHLLNNGHPSRNGGWTNGDQHITNAHRTVIGKLLEAAKEVLNEA